MSDFYIDLDLSPKFKRPELLYHPPIPTPLHGVNPRSIMGHAKWKEVRYEVYAVNNDCCWACGVHKTLAKGRKKWLEAHEIYDIDYKKGKMELREIVALCHYCHSYVHRSRLAALVESHKVQRKKLERVLAHGEALLKGVKPWYNEKKIEKQFVNSKVKWDDWRLVWKGKEYGPVHLSMEAYVSYYDKLSS